MSETEPDIQAADSPGTPRWKKVLIAVAVLFLILGFSMQAMAKEAPEQASGMSSAQGVSGANSFLGEGQTPGIGGGQVNAVKGDDSLSSYSPFFVKGGFSFLIAFCVGWALRTFFKISAFFVGVIAIALFGLNKLGWVDVDWSTMSDQWDRISGKVMAHADGAKEFITGSLPSVGMGSLGLFTGFKKG